MKSITTILKIAILILISQNSILACSCFPYEPVFCRVVNEGHNIIRGVVTNHPDFHLMEINLIENLNKEIVEDTILILGQDGFNCGEYLSLFNINDTLILALSHWEINGTNYWYLEGFCGLHFLRYENGIVNGQITDTLTSQPLQDYKDNLFSCLDMEVPINEIANDEFQLTLYPNPVSGHFQVSTLQPQIAAYEIYDLSGTKMEVKAFSQLEEKIEINSNGLEQGIYYISIRTPKGIITRKFLKI